MQILYVTTMVAVFVLCVALLTTARRILRTTPLQAGEFVLPRIDGLAKYLEQPAELQSQQKAIEEDAIASGPALSMSAESFIAEIKTVEQAHTERVDLSESVEHAYGVESAFHRTSSTASGNGPKDPYSAPEPQLGGIVPARKPSTPAYKYFLEVLLIGVSVVVLVRTQRSTARLRLPHSSRGRVA